MLVRVNPKGLAHWVGRVVLFSLFFLNILIAFLLDSGSHVSSAESCQTAETEDPRHGLVAHGAAGLLQELEDDGAGKGGDDLRGGDGDVVDAEHDTGLVGALRRVLATGQHLAFTGGRRLDQAATDVLALTDLTGDESERCPVCHRPRDADSAHEDDGSLGVTDDKSKPAEDSE
jgi:hypothetical protein